MKIVIHGFGKMGRIIYDLAIEQGIEVVGVIDQFTETQVRKLSYEDLGKIDYDIVVDFSHFSIVDNLISALEKSPHKAIIATTKLSEEQLERVKKLSEKVAVFQDYNTSYGVYVLNQTLKFMTGLLSDYDVEMIESHHKYKVDAESGTANRLINTIKAQRELNCVYDYSKTNGKNSNDIGVHSIRSGNIVGDHEVLFGSDNDLISIKHQALSKNLFADGAIRICYKLQNKEAGLYKLEEVFD